VVDRSLANSRKVRTFRSGPYLNNLFREAQERMDELELAEICARLKLAREQAGLSQEAIGEMLDPPVGQRAVANYEKVRVPWRYLSQWAEITGTTRPWLIHGEQAAELPEAVERRLAGLEARMEGLEAKASAIDERMAQGFGHVETLLGDVVARRPRPRRAKAR